MVERDDCEADGGSERNRSEGQGRGRGARKGNARHPSFLRPVPSSILPPPMGPIHPRAHDNHPHHCPNHPSLPTLSPNPVNAYTRHLPDLGHLGDLACAGLSPQLVHVCRRPSMRRCELWVPLPGPKASSRKVARPDGAVNRQVVEEGLAKSNRKYKNAT